LMVVVRVGTETMRRRRDHADAFAT
jgi:hypothetical protein